MPLCVEVSPLWLPDSESCADKTNSFKHFLRKQIKRKLLGGKKKKKNLTDTGFKVREV